MPALARCVRPLVRHLSASGLFLVGAAVACATTGPAPAREAGENWPAPAAWCAPPSCTATADVIVSVDLPAHDWLPGHRGVDVAAMTGQTVHAPAAGEVTFAGSVGGRPLVVLRHVGGRRSTLEPVEPAVHVGDVVRRGESIGTFIDRGSHCPGCLHWGVRESESYINPLQLLHGGPIVLLPLRPAGTPAQTTRAGDPR